MHAYKIPWNKGKAVGQKHPFTPQQIDQISRKLEFEKRFRELTLFTLGIDTMLRSSDLLRLKVSDVMDGPNYPKSSLNWRQQKTGNSVVLSILPYAQSAVCCYVAADNLQMADYLFASKRTDQNKPFGRGYLRRLIKRWATEIGLNPEHYSGHSLRRSKPTYMYRSGVQPAYLRLLLGQRSLDSTQAYLGIDQNDALDLARHHDIFKETSNANK